MNKFWWLLLIVILVFRVLPARASTLTSTQNLSFGTLIPTATSGSVSISTAGAINTGGSVTIAPSGTSYYQGLMNFTGTGLGALLEIVTISVLDNSITMTNNRSGGGTVTVNNFITSNSISVNLLNPNVNNIPLGGTMIFNSSSKGGSYTGSVRVRANGLLTGTADATVPVRLTLWNTLNMNQVTQLNFGSIERLTGNAVVRINAQTGARTIVSGASGINLINSPTPTAGQFSITGEPNANISISLPSSATLSGNNGGTMTVNNFTRSPSGSETSLDSSGNRTLLVGANLNIGTNQITGTYTGTYVVTVNY